MPNRMPRQRVSPIPAVALLAAAAIASAIAPGTAAQTYELLEADASVAYRYPGADGRVGTGDDVVSADVTTIVGSDPNLLGRHSFGVFEAFVADPALPGAKTAISFVGGTIEIDPAVAAYGGGPPIVTASGDWFWATGQPDAQNRSLTTTTANSTIPPHPRWSPSSDFELALAIEPGAPAAVPALGGLALAALAPGLLCAGLLAATARTPRPSLNTPPLNTDPGRKP